MSWLNFSRFIYDKFYKVPSGSWLMGESVTIILPYGFIQQDNVPYHNVKIVQEWI